MRGLSLGERMKCELAAALLLIAVGIVLVITSLYGIYRAIA